jgi:hypothetical protein
MYYTNCLRKIDWRTQCPICYLQTTEGNSELCWRYSGGLRMALYLPNHLPTWKSLLQRNLRNRSNKGFLWSDATILVDHETLSQGICRWRDNQLWEQGMQEDIHTL